MASIARSRDHRKHAVLALLCCALTPAFLCAQQLVKWTDAEGRVHYSDHAPQGQSTEAVEVPKAPTLTSAEKAKLTRQRAEFEPGYRSEQSKTKTWEENVRRNEAEKKASDKKREQERDANAQMQLRSDNALVDKCKQARNTYCGEGPDAIRNRELDSESLHRIEKDRAWKKYIEDMKEYVRLRDQGRNVQEPIAPK